MEMENLDPGFVRFENDPVLGKYGELFTTAIVTVTVVWLRVLAAWLLKHQQHNRIRKQIEIVYADGSERIEALDIDLKVKAPREAVLKELANLTGVDLTALQHNA